MAPDAWFELEFNDGSQVVIAGNSMLTISDLGQKELRLREGSFSANVIPQPKGKPMLVRTRSPCLKSWVRDSAWMPSYPPLRSR